MEIGESTQSATKWNAEQCFSFWVGVKIVLYQLGHLDGASSKSEGVRAFWLVECHMAKGKKSQTKNLW